MAYTNRNFTWDFDALKRFYEKYIVKWLNSAVSWTEAQKKQARANLGFGDGDGIAYTEDNASSDLDIADESGNVLVQLKNGHIKTKNFDSTNMDVSINDTTDADLKLSDEAGNILAEFKDGHIKTKNFDSRHLTSNEYKNFVGSPSVYVPDNLDTNGLSVFQTVESLYEAFDNLVEQYPDWLAREEDIGKDASGLYDMRHYTLRMQHPSIHADRAAITDNLWDDSLYKYNRILINMSVHSNEVYSTLGGYLAVKEILESNESWAIFIKNNFIIDIVPCNNPWGLNNGKVNVNYNNVNLNRDYKNGTDAQQETKNMKALIQQLISKGLVAVIDLHNASSGHGGYFVSKVQYKYYNYYALVTQQIQALTYKLWEQIIPTKPSDGNFYHLWNYADTSSVGQLHEYIDSLGLYGGTFEVLTSLGYEGSLMSKILCINYINLFGTNKQ